jgi:hypothetical protein
MKELPQDLVNAIWKFKKPDKPQPLPQDLNRYDLEGTM